MASTFNDPVGTRLGASASEDTAVIDVRTRQGASLHGGEALGRMYYRVLLGCWLWVAYSGFFIEELAPWLAAVRMPLGMAVDALILVAGLTSIRRWGEALALVSLVMISYVSTVWLNEIPVSLYANGMRDFVALMFLPPLLRRLMADGTRQWVLGRFDRQLYIWLWVQLPCILWQLIRYGSGDHCGGSMGNGFTGIVSTGIYIVSFYLMTLRWRPDVSYVANLRQNLVLVLLLIPTFLNETKVSFVFFAVYFVLLFALDRTFLPKLGVLIPVLAVFGFLAFTLYSTTSGNSDAATEEYLTEYLSGDTEIDIEDAADAFQEGAFDDEDWDVDVPRVAKLLFLPVYLDDEEGGGWWMGRGVGHFKGWDSKRTTKFYRDNQWIMYGTFPYLFSIGLQMGILGLAWVIGFFVYNTQPRRRGYPLAINVKIFIYIIAGVILFYNDSLRDMGMMIILFYIALATSYDHGPRSERDSAGVQDAAVAA